LAPIGLWHPAINIFDPQFAVPSVNASRPCRSGWRLRLPKSRAVL